MQEEMPQQDVYVEERSEIIKVVPERDYLLPGSILIAGILISGSIIYLVGSGTRTSGDSPAQAGGAGVPAAVLELTARDVILGDPKASVTFIEYGDYQCPFCARFFKGAEKQIRDTYVKEGKVRMVFRNLAFLGPESTAAALAAECAKDQGKFWAFHDAVYEAEYVDAEEHNGNLNRVLFLDIARALGMDADAFASCIDSNKYAAELEAENEAAHAFGVNSTPTSFVNGTKAQGALPFTSLQPMIDKALQKK